MDEVELDRLAEVSEAIGELLRLVKSGEIEATLVMRAYLNGAVDVLHHLSVGNDRPVYT